MPYIDPAEQNMVRPHTTAAAETTGDLNFQVTCLVIDYLRAHGLSYSSINDIVGALDGAKAEFQRRVVAPYEDDCIKLNGDVFPEAFTQGRPNKSMKLTHSVGYSDARQ